MVKRTAIIQIWVLAGVMGLAVSVAAASPVPVGSLVGSKNATLDGQTPLPHTTVLSGDHLQVNDGLAMVTLDQGNRMILGGGSEASFSREGDAVTVSLARGKLSLYDPGASSGFRVKVGDVTVTPARGARTLGEVAMADGLLLVTAKDGALEVEKGGATKEVGKGKTVTIATTAARAPVPTPGSSGNGHVSRKSIVTVAVAVGGTAATLATIALTRTTKQASAVTPLP